MTAADSPRRFRRRLLATAVATGLGLTLAAAPAQAHSSDDDHRSDRDHWSDDDHWPGRWNRTTPVQLLAINDLHGNLEPPQGSSGRIVDETGQTVPAGGAAYLATWLKKLRTRDGMVVAAGDSIGASPLLSAAYHDEPTIEFLNTAGVTASAVGNHEFDEGITELRRIVDGGCHPTDGCSPDGEYTGTDFPYLGANVLDEKTGRPALPAYTIRNVHGARIGFIGVVTKTTPSIVTAAGIEGLKFVDEVQAADAAARQLQRRGVQAIVLLMHEGDSVSGGATPDSCRTTPGAGTTIASKVSPTIDLVLSGHSHQQYVCKLTDPAGNPRFYSQGASFGRVITEARFDVDRRSRDVVRSSVVVDNHVVTHDVAPDPRVQRQIEKWQGYVAPVANAVIGSITADLTRDPAPSGETTLGDVIADAQLSALSAPGSGGAQVAVMNPGGIRTDLAYASSPAGEGDGNVTYGEAFAVQPFNNLMQVTTLTGTQLDTLLEQQWQTDSTGAPVRRTLQVSSSLRYTMDESRPIGDRVSQITVSGTPVDPSGSYRVAANNFLMGGGDGFTELTKGSDLFNGPLDIDTFADYLGAHSPVAPPALDRISKVG